METHVDFSSICQLFEKAKEDGRDFLYEFEVYDLIRYVGSETPPGYVVLPKNARLSKEQLEELPGEKVVIKIVSPFILHKSDVGGVQIVNKTVEDVLSTMRRMYSEISTTFREMIERGKYPAPNGLDHLLGDDLGEAVRESLTGIMLCQYMHPDSQEFGNELLVSLRNTREFGMMLSAGLGGTDTELYAKRFKKGQAVVTASTEMVGGAEFFRLFQKTISYRKMAGLTRGQQRIVSDEQLLECFSALIEVGRFFSLQHAAAPFVIDELEINPFAFSNYLMMPLDGLCRFSKPQISGRQRPVDKIDKLLHPHSIGIVGASSKKMNIGRIILDNILNMGFPEARLTLIHPSAARIGTIAALPSLRSIPQRLDMLILAVNGENIPGMVAEIIQYDLAESVVLIPGGLGEVDGHKRVLLDMLESIDSARSEAETAPVLLGGNSLGVLSHPGRYDALFIPESKLPRKKGGHRRKSALVSQSGAYMITRMSKLSFLDPAYAISIGNQVDLTAGDFLLYFKAIEELQTIAFYMEGFTDLDGLSFSEAVRDVIPEGKEIIFYKAGRTPEGKTAMSGHTASIAGDYMVCESCVSQAGAFVAETFSEFEGLLRLSCALHHKKILGNRLAAVSNAGYEAVGIADNILGEDYSLQMSEFQTRTIQELDKVIDGAGLQSLVSTVNPMDVTPMASEKVYVEVIRSLLGDDNIDVVIVAIVPLTPILHTLADEHIADDTITTGLDIVEKIAELNNQTQKPLVIVVDSGSLYDHMANGLEEIGLPVFRSADHAVRVLGKYVQTRMAVAQLQK
jgi:acyl-CoA synthetase (NDP forming)